MVYKLAYHPDVKKVDLPKIDAKNKVMIKAAIENRLSIHPEIYGSPLRRTLKGYWKLKVGEYRIVYKISSNKIYILGIINRKDVYSEVEKRHPRDCKDRQSENR
ncbi:MAG: type II toxin-antitoxin system RelE/ParE family toxin [Thermodesulfobacteriota bacterium]|nr:type II toxin-antitoxin system RelE/ParE family toxin [Thermodesulfobacteriota bacterium]